MTLIKTSVALLIFSLLSGSIVVGHAQAPWKTANSEDAYITATGSSWKMGTAKVEKIVTFSEGGFYGESWIDKVTGNALIASGAKPDEFFMMLEKKDHRVGSSEGGWKLVEAKQHEQSDKTLELEIALQKEALLVRKFYVIYPGSSIIRERCEITNTGEKPLRLIDPGFLGVSARFGNLEKLDFNWMTGAENQAGSWTLKTERLQAEQTRAFDSFDAFPATADIKQFAGDGVNVKVMLNEHQIWPEKDWKHVSNAEAQLAFDLRVSVVAGDRVAFIVNAKKNDGWDSTSLDPVIMTAEGVRHQASEKFSGSQGKDQWCYQWERDGVFKDMIFDPQLGQWQREDDRGTGRPFIRSGTAHPDSAANAARVWTAESAGEIHIKGVASNSGNRVNLGKGSGFKLGSSAYAPWYSLLHQDTKQGVFIGWDYLGHWRSEFTTDREGNVRGVLKVAGFDKLLKKGETVQTPEAFTGLFQNDLDHAGNECLDWQYQYLWDYTRNDWFSKIRILGDWAGGTAWGLPETPWTGGDADLRSTYLKIFRVADLIREVGGDVYHRDWGWWDRAGDWNGADFGSANEYLGKSGIGLLMYAFLYTVDPASRVAVNHPDWVLNHNTLDLSRPEVAAFILSQLDDFMKRWGNFEWRNDSNPLSPRYDDDTPLLAQDQAYRRVIRTFLDKYPKASFQSVNSGGNAAGYDYVRYSSVLQFSDGAVGNLGSYYASLLFPPDKIQDIPDLRHIEHYNKTVWRGMLCSNFSIGGMGNGPQTLEGARELIQIYHYLHREGVVGRWVHVYRPNVAGDDPSMYFQRMSRDARRGIIIPKHKALQPVTIKPKGLLPDTDYTISLHEAGTSEVRNGQDLMTNGITIEKMNAGELIYFNLTSYPGNKLDTQPPGAPSNVQKSNENNMGFPGVEITWKRATDDQWVACYELFRDGVLLDVIAKGTYCFDHSAGANIASRYEVCTVDGAGNKSALSSALSRRQEQGGSMITILDDRESSPGRFQGRWTPSDNLAAPIHLGTMTSSLETGASFELEFEGTEVRWYSKLGRDGGIAHVQVDELPPDAVDTYAADEITGVCLYSKTLKPGAHKIRITVSGEQSRYSSGKAIYVDGFQIKAR